MYSSPFNSFQGSSSSPVMEQNNEDVEQLNYNKGKADEMSEEEIEMIEDESNEGGQKVDGDEGVSPFEKSKGRRNPGIENKVSSIIVDNVSYNDMCIRRLREDFSLRKRLNIGENFFHVRCCAHILNLLVQDGLGQLGSVIDVVREWIKWNITYLMLALGLEFKDVFPRYADIDSRFHHVPTNFEWMKVEEVCKFLGIFHEITDMISGSEYPTANIFLVELYRIKELLNKKALDPYEHIRAMAGSMSTKFDKYWGKSNVLLSLGAILDPRYKMFLINHAFLVIYGEDATPRFVAEIRDILYEFYNEYIDCHIVSHSEQQQRQVVKRRQNEGSSSSSKKASKIIGPAILTGKEKFHMHVSEINRAPPEKSNLVVYLEESRYACDANANLDVLA
nr:zinc finger BED domain-containing protein RICESLEEPER 1-like [Coffea arabica]